MAGLFITFEGQEGAGKSTQAKLLHTHLSSLGLDVILVREPGGTAISEKIRYILKDTANAAITKETEVLMYIAARAQLTNEVIYPYLLRGGIVICDRFTDSTIAYQGFGNKLDIDMLASMSNFATNGLKPHICFLLKIDPTEGLARKSRIASLDRVEQKPMSYHMAVKEGYDYLANMDKKRIKVIDAGLSEQEIHRIVCGNLSGLIPNIN